MANLEKIVAANKSPRAANTLAELLHASASGQTAKSSPEAAAAAAEKKVLAAKYYMISAEQGDVVGSHWTGVFFMEGFGCNINYDKAIANLTAAAE